MFNKALAAFVFGAALVSAAPQTPTFHKDVLPILQKHCQGCHRPGEIGPMSLLTYKDARPWAKSIKAAVSQGKMPPWHADPAYGHFVNDRRLSKTEAETLTAWVDTGAKEGNAKDAPAPLTFPQGWTIGKPDMVVEMPNDFVVPAQGTVDYSWIVIPTGLTEDKWIDKIEVRPGERSVVHHAVLYIREPGSGFMKAAKPGVPFVPPGRKGTPEKQPDRGVGIWEFQANAPGVQILAIYVPGGQAYTVKPGQGRLVKAGSDLVLQMHYTANGKEARDRTKVGMVFAKEQPKERVFHTFLANPWLRIPPGDGNFKVTAVTTIANDVAIQSLTPHMHLRGKAFQYRLIYPDGKDEILLKVPRYDFNWQITYELPEPKKAPAGSKLECIAWFDNSPNNPHNPDPKMEVPWGDQSWEEMLAGFVDFVVPVDFQPTDLIRAKKKPEPAKTGAE
jgi:hypothetical protein